MVRALAKMTEERMKTMIDALFKYATIFLTTYCPQNPANIETAIKYMAVQIYKSDENPSKETSL